MYEIKVILNKPIQTIFQRTNILVTNLVCVQINFPHVVGKHELLLLLEEAARNPDDVRGWGQQELLAARQALGQEGNYRK